MIDILKGLTQTPAFGLIITILTYGIGVWLNKKAKTPLVNPLLISLLLIIGILVTFRIPYHHYEIGGDMIEIFLAPATAVLAIKIYQQFQLLKENWFPILLGAAVGAGVSIVCVMFLCKFFAVEENIFYALLPKSVTTAIALPLSELSGGYAPVTVAAVIITGVFGAVFAPSLIQLFRIKNPIEAGIAIGTSSHALGATKAIEIGDVEGAMSGIAIGVAGLLTVIYLAFF